MPSAAAAAAVCTCTEKKGRKKKKKQSEDDRTKRENNNKLGRTSHTCLNLTLSWLHSEMIPSGMFSTYSSNHVYQKYWPFTVMLWDFWKLAGFNTALIRSQLMEMYSLTFMPLKGCFSALLWNSHPDISLLNLGYLFSNDSYLRFFYTIYRREACVYIHIYILYIYAPYLATSISTSNCAFTCPDASKCIWCAAWWKMCWWKKKDEPPCH